VTTPTCPTTALGRSECAEFLRTTMAAGFPNHPGCDITVSTAPPLVASPYGANSYECPHGVTYWIEPTSEQIADWAARGVA
jgi:hypothetical protein